MEAKERFELQEIFEDGSFHWYLKDNDTKLLKPLVNLYDCVDLLNQQDKENQQLKQQLHDLPKQIVGEIKEQLFNHFNVKNIEEYEKLPLIDSLFTADIMVEVLDIILKKYGGENE